MKDVRLHPVYRLFAPLTLCLLLLSAVTVIAGEDDSTDPRLRMYKRHLEMTRRSPFRNLPWQFIGPVNTSGRMTDVAVVAPKGRNYTIYIAGASGGVWKTDNEGVTWVPVFEHGMSTSIGDIALDPSDPNVLWVGTGEANIFRSSHAGAGVYRSPDGGKTWQHKGLTSTNTIARIVVHPENPDIVYVAASGNEWTHNPERGVYKTIDGGMTWEKVKYIDEETGAIDLVMDPSDPNTLYAAFWQRTRLKWNDPRCLEDHQHSGIFKTTDGGASWTPINDGLLAANHRGRIGLDLCAAQPRTLYAFVDNYEIYGEYDGAETDSYGRPRGKMIKGATVYRSDNGGETWRQVSKTDDYMTRLSSTYGWVFGQMRVDPVNPDKIYVMGLGLHVSDDSGSSFRALRGMHGDHHGLWIDPENTDYLVNVNDGGLAISYDGGENWRTFYDNLPLVQFFNVMYDMDEPFHVYGSVQDHGSRRGVVDLSRGRGRIPALEWENAPGGEGSSHAIDPTNPDIVYSAGFYGSISRTDLSTGEYKNIMPEMEEGSPKLRGQWVAPFIISPHNPRIIYLGMQYLFRSMDRGDSWERISPDLTWNDPKKMGDIPYQTIFTVSESPLKFGMIYAGTDDGRLHVTLNSGDTWKEITRGLKKDRWISRVAASAFDLNTVYVAQNGKRNDDFTPYLWKSVNGGKSWQDISGGIPCGTVNVVREDPKNPDIIYAGTDLGVYVSLDRGATFYSLPGDLPTTFCHDLVIHPRDDIMVVATHGRGMWAMDVRPLRAVAENSGRPLIFGLDPVRMPRWGRPAPVQIAYYLPSTAEVSLVVKNAEGSIVAELKAAGEAGYNLGEWNISGGEQRIGPGTYTVELTAGGGTASTAISIER
ncbi:hypothetical protein JXO52_10135 [bacterium]|nr:hypothetical protein [bacterium]